METAIVETAAVEVPTQVAVSANPLVVVGVVAVAAGAIVTGVVVWRKIKARRNEADVIVVEPTN